MRKDGSQGRDGSDFSLQTMCSGPSLVFIWEAGSSSGFLCWGKRCGPLGGLPRAGQSLSSGSPGSMSSASWLFSEAGGGGARGGA